MAEYYRNSTNCSSRFKTTPDLLQMTKRNVLDFIEQVKFCCIFLICIFVFLDARASIVSFWREKTMFALLVSKHKLITFTET